MMTQKELNRVIFKTSKDVKVEGNVVTKRVTGWGNGLLLVGKSPVQTGIARWSFKIQKGRKITVGVCLHDVQLNSYVNQTEKGWGYYQSSGKRGHNGPARIKYGDSYKSPLPCIIDVELNTTKGTLRFYKDGVDQGVAFHDLPIGGKFVGAVSMYERGDQITFLSSTQKRDDDRERASSIQEGMPRILYKSQYITFDRDNVLTKKKSGWDNGLVMFSDVVSSGKARWSFKSMQGRKMTIGVCLEDVDRNSYVNRTTKGWGYYQSNGRKGHGGPAKTEYGEHFKRAGDLVEVELDCDKGELRFYKNGRDQGVAYRDLPIGARFVGAVSLYAEGDSVQVVGMKRRATHKESLSRSASSSTVSGSVVASAPVVVDAAAAAENRSASRSHFDEARLLAPRPPKPASSEAPPPRASLSSKRASSSYVASRDTFEKRINTQIWKCSDDILIDKSDGRRVRKMQTGWENGLVLIGDPVRSGKAKWVVKLDKARKATVGVALTSVRMTSYVNQTKRGWGYYQSNGRIGHGGPAKEVYGCPFKEKGAIVEVELDANTGKLRFAKDGKDQGIAFFNLPVSPSNVPASEATFFVGAVSLYGEGDHATLLSVHKNVDKRARSKHLNGEMRSPALPNVVSSSSSSSVSLAPIEANAKPIRSLLVYSKPEAIVIDGPKAIKISTGWDDGLLLLGDAVSEGTARWSIKMGKSRKATVGVCLTSVETKGYVNKTLDGWGYYQPNGRRGHGGPAKEEYGLPFKREGIVVDIVLNCDEGTLTFYRDGVNQGVAFRNLPRRANFVGAVSLYGSGDFVTVLAQPGSRDSVEESLPISIGSDSSSSITGRKHALKLNDIVTTWLLRQGFSREAVSQLVYSFANDGFDSLLPLSTMTRDDLNEAIPANWTTKERERTIRVLLPAIEKLRDDPIISQLSHVLFGEQGEADRNGFHDER